MKCLIIFYLALLQSSNVLALINGKPLLGKPDLVRLEFNEKDSICSGFFVTPSLIVTSAHCLRSWRDGSLAKLTGIISINGKLDLEALELIPHPYYESGWATHDVAVIRVSNNSSFKGDFFIGENLIPTFGILVYNSAGKIDMQKKTYGRSIGQASYFAFASYVIGYGPSSIAANDSGSPVIMKETGEVIAVASQSTAIDTSWDFLPALSISTSLEDKSNREFLLKYMNEPKPSQ